MSNSNSDAGKASDSDDSAKPSTSIRPKRNAPRPSVVETDSSDSEQDNAVKVAKMKAKKPRKSAHSASPESNDDMSKSANKKEASQLNELDREMLIFKQMQEMELKKQREDLRRSLNKIKSKKAGKKADSNDEFQEYSSSSESEGEIREKKRPKLQQSVENEDSDPDMGYHRPSEVSAKRNKKKAMDELLLKRRDKKEADEKRKEQKRGVLDLDEIFGVEGPRSTSSSSSSSRSSSRSSSAIRSRSQSPETKKEIENLDDLKGCKLSRITLARFVHLPFFNKLAIGCYVRIGIGQNNGRAVYRIAEITDVVETAKVYTVENTRTNKGIKLRHASDQRVYRLEFVSNQPFEEKEWLQWMTSMKTKNLTLPTMDQVANKKKDIEHFASYNLTSTEIDYMIKEKQRFLNAPTNYAVEKSRLMKMKADAEEQGNISRAKEIQHEIDELDAKADDIEHQRNAKLSAVALINQKRRVEMKQNFLDPKKIVYDPIRQDDPFTRKSNRTKVVSGASKRAREEDSQNDPTVGSSASSTQPSDSQSSSNATTTSNGTLQSPAKKFSSMAGLHKSTSNANAVKQFAGHSGIELDIDI